MCSWWIDIPFIFSNGSCLSVYIFWYLYAYNAAKSLQLLPTLCDHIDGSPPGSLIPKTVQARTPEWVAVAFSNA